MTLKISNTKKPPALFSTGGFSFFFYVINGFVNYPLQRVFALGLTVMTTIYVPLRIGKIENLIDFLFVHGDTARIPALYHVYYTLGLFNVFLLHKLGILYKVDRHPGIDIPENR